MADVLDDIIILRSVFGKVGQKYFMNPVRDPKTGRYPSCVRPVDSKGDMIISDKDRNEGKPLIPENKVFIIEDGTTFNLMMSGKGLSGNQFNTVLSLLYQEMQGTLKVIY